MDDCRPLHNYCNIQVDGLLLHRPRQFRQHSDRCAYESANHRIDTKFPGHSSPGGSDQLALLRTVSRDQAVAAISAHRPSEVTATVSKDQEQAEASTHRRNRAPKGQEEKRTRKDPLFLGFTGRDAYLAALSTDGSVMTSPGKIQCGSLDRRLSRLASITFSQ